MSIKTIAEYAEQTGTLHVIPADGDTSTTIADLAQFVKFDTQEARMQDTTPWCVAFGELVAEYGSHEMVAGEQDYYDGFFMQFADGSELRYAAS